MRNLWRLPIAFLFVAILSNVACAQIPGGAGVTQSGAVTANNCAKWSASGVIADSGGTCGGTGSPGGSNTQVQYNNSGAFGGISGATTNGTALTLVAPILGTPASGTLTNTAGFPVANLAGAGTGVLTALGVNVGSAGAPIINGGVLGTPSSGTATNLTGTAAGLTAGNVTTNANLTGAITSVGNASSLGSFSSANLLAALTIKTGTGSAVFGTAPTITSPTIGTAATLSYITGSTQCLHVDTSGVLTGTGSDCGAGGGSGTVTSVSAGCGASTGGSPITTTGTVSAAVTTRANTATSDTIVSADCGNLLTESNASAIAVAIAQAGTTGFASGTFFEVCNKGAGAATVTPTTSTIGGAATFVLPAASAARPACVVIISDGTNYGVAPEFPMDASMFSAGTVAAARLPFGTGVGTAAALNLSAAGGLTSTIASGTSALGTGAIGSAACATAVTTAATNTATTDVVSWGFNGDPTAVTGYVPLVAGMLTIIAYPTSGNVNFKVCNNTNASVTPGAITLNWRVVR